VGTVIAFPKERASSSAQATGVGGPEAARTWRELVDLGYELRPMTRIDVKDYEGKGSHALTVADRLLVRGPAPLRGVLRVRAVRHKPYLLAGACVAHPPVDWLEWIVERHQHAPGKMPLSTLAANTAALCGLHPRHDRARCEPVIEEALRARRGPS
jgi:hypothetical protein